MAKLSGNILFTGTLGNVTAYKRHDSDTIILRQKGGPTRKQVVKDKKFENVRRNMSEFTGRARATWWLRQLTQPLHLCGDTRFTNRIFSLAKRVQEKDTVSEFGKRGIPFSLYPKLFEGFNLNRYHSFDSIIRNPLYAALSKDTLTATVDIPSLIPGVNFITPFFHPYFRVTTVLGLLPDLRYDPQQYKPVGYRASHPLIATVHTEWFTGAAGLPAQQLTITLPTDKIPSIYTLVLSVGIIAGKPSPVSNDLMPVKYAGAARILMME